MNGKARRKGSRQFMDAHEATRAWRAHGFVVLPGYLPVSDLAPARAELGQLFPSADGFHDRSDPRYRRFLGGALAGLDPFPFASPELSLLAGHERLAALARALLGDDDLRICAAAAQAAYTGAADYGQALHRAQASRTGPAPSGASGFEQAELAVYLCDVPEELGPPHVVPLSCAAARLAQPDWDPPVGVPGRDGFVSVAASPALYEAEVSAAGPAGTVVAWSPASFHRGTSLTAPRGARYTLQLRYRLASAGCGRRQAWAERRLGPPWSRFAARASPAQLRLFG
jgi:hypothetical protein